MENFTPLTSLLGGLLIGVSAAIMILMNGRIAGISGILGSIPSAHRADISWRVTFIIGLVLSPFVYLWFSPLPVVTLEASHLQIVIAGLFVGLGSRLGSGCTSGHGVCGIARLSPRSIIATLIFISAGVVTVYVSHY